MLIFASQIVVAVSNPKAKALTQSPARSEWFWNRMKSNYCNYCMDQGVCEGENALSARIFVSPRAAKNNFCIGKTQSQNDIINFAAPDWSNHGIRAATEKIYKSVLALTISSRGEKIKTHWANSRRPPAGMLALHVWITRRCDDAGLVCSRKHGPENI